MYKQCTTEKAAHQQKAIEQSLLEAMQNQEYNSITVKSLCEQTTLSRMTFYRLFDNKDDVLYALIDQTLQSFTSFSLLDNQIIPNEYTYFQRLYTYWYQQKPLLKALCSNQMSDVLMERAINHITNEDSETMHLIGAEGASDRKEVLRFFLSGIISLIIGWHQSGYEKTILEMSQITYQLLIHPPLRSTPSIDKT